MKFRTDTTKRIFSYDSHKFAGSVFLFMLWFIILLGGISALSGNYSNESHILDSNVMAIVQNSTVSLNFSNETGSDSVVTPLGKSELVDAGTEGRDRGIRLVPTQVTPNLTDTELARNASETTDLLKLTNFTTFLQPSALDVKEFNLTDEIENSLVDQSAQDLSIREVPITRPSIIVSSVSEGRDFFNSGAHYPPDPSVAAGDDFVLQFVNLAGQINAVNGSLIKTFDLRSFFNIGNNFIFDPRVVYDNSSGRFFASIADSTNGSVRLAVSQPHNPLMEWDLFNFNFSTQGLKCPDVGINNIAVSRELVAIVANLFGNRCQGIFEGVQKIIVDKWSLLNMNDSELTDYYVTDPDPSSFSEIPVSSMGMRDELVFANVGNGTQAFHVNLTRYSGNLENLSRSVVQVPISPLTLPPTAVQPVTDIRIKTTAGLTSGAMKPDSNEIWLTANDGCRPVGGLKIQSCIRVLEVDIGTGLADQDFDVTSRSIDLYNPAATLLGSGDMIMTFSASSPSMVPSIFITGHLNNETGLNKVEQPVLVKPGNASLERCYGPGFPEDCRFGDESSISPSPNPTKGLSAWITGQYMQTPDRWGTVVSEVQVTPGATSPRFEDILPPQGDLDGDGLLNGWEQFGYDFDNDSRIDLDLPSLGANAQHKDVFVEIDFMEHHEPNRTALDHVIGNFSSAPVNNPDGIAGINFHIETDEEIPHEDWTDTFELVSIKRDHFGTEEQRSDPNANDILNAKKAIYHYGLFAHDQRQFPGSSGRSNGIPGMEFMVTLGAPGWKQDKNGHNVGNYIQQEATLMHEIGHNFNLEHAGDNWRPEYKPNYPSVMNYLYQLADLVPDRPLDYSRCESFPLNEQSLVEAIGIGNNCTFGMKTFHGPPPCLPAKFGEPVDFNRDGDTLDQNVTTEVNCFSGNGIDGSLDILTGYSDWDKLVYIVDPSERGASLASKQVEEITPQHLNEHMAQSLALIYNDLLSLNRQSGIVSPEAELNLNNTVTNTSNPNGLSAILLSDNPDRFQVGVDALTALDSTVDPATSGAAINLTAQNEISEKIDRLKRGLENQIK